LTLNLENHESTCGFHSGYLQTWLHWNNEISIDDLKTDAIVLVASISVKLKLHSLNKIIFFKKIIKHVVKAKKKLTLKSCRSTKPRTYGEMDFNMKGPPRCCEIALDDPTSWVDVCASGACSWSEPNDLWSSVLLLEE
jgi:hypothetical protein